jgi:hypothetical protein
MNAAPVLALSHPPSRADRCRRLRAWGITYAMIAEELAVSRQYVWQVLHRTIPVSMRMDAVVRGTAEALIVRQQSSWTIGRKMRSARIVAGLTLKQAAAHAGYSWVAVQRWEKDLCLPKPGVLWHLRMIYGVDEDWTPGSVGKRLSA